MANWPVCLDVRPPSGAHDQIFFTVGHLRSLCCGAPSLMRGRASYSTRTIFCHFLVQVPQISWQHFTVSFGTLPTWRARFLYLYPPGAGGPVIPLGNGFPFCRLSQLAGIWWRYSNLSPHGKALYIWLRGEPNRKNGSLSCGYGPHRWSWEKNFG
jgi:hypothetical protein